MTQKFIASPNKRLTYQINKSLSSGRFSQSIYDDGKVIINNISLRKYPPHPSNKKNEQSLQINVW